MKLTEVQINLFRNIIDSTTVQIDQKVTSVVGKNESGKTAFLEALYRLNPARQGIKYSVPEQYPAWLEKKDRQRGINLDEVKPARAVFSLEHEDIIAIEQRFGPGVLTSNTITLSREYGGKRIFSFDTDELKAISHVVGKAEIPPTIASEAKKNNSFDELSEYILKLKDQDENAESESTLAATALEAQIKETLGDETTLRKAVINVLDERTPKFFYFADYSKLLGKIKIRELLEADPADLDADEHTTLSLLRLAATDNEYLLNPDYERRKRELENIANAITLDVLKYWEQNPDLRVQIDITQETQTNAKGQPVSVLDELQVRIWDERHWLSLPFHERSTGFRWFFSFLVAFSKYEWAELPIIILLDEPALGLHARAQKDFLRFIDERLALKHQVIYTTHSPFMIQPDKLERVRVVEDRGRDNGSQVTADILSTDRDTIFPLQAALGYDLAQHLFIAPHNLVVEGTSDYTYLSVISDFLGQQGRTYLDERWSIIPVGGADLIPSFVALLGHHLDVTVLVDARKSGHQRLSSLADAGYLTHNRIITVGEVIGRKYADIEDVFTIKDYLLLYNKAFSTSIKPEDLKGTDPIVSRIARYQAIERFDHGRPADLLLRHRDELMHKLDKETLDRFEKLFERLNSTLPSKMVTPNQDK